MIEIVRCGFSIHGDHSHKPASRTLIPDMNTPHDPRIPVVTASAADPRILLAWIEAISCFLYGSETGWSWFCNTCHVWLVEENRDLTLQSATIVAFCNTSIIPMVQ